MECELLITLRKPGAAPISRRLTSPDPAAGDHPRPAEAVAAIEAAGPDPWSPVPPGTIATMIYGGPDTATVSGTCDGAPVSATFNRTNGAEIARWKKLAPLLEIDPNIPG